ncbi:MAG TPA: sulfatase-like hydrolase/transferase [Chloroflexota bacterium]|nr:sulfatase-like hydrolase/transferase [Chloroflexota bacterium]
MVESPALRRPNILHILSDQHSPYVLGCYGDGVVHTPNLDRIAAHGALFESAYCPSPICVPSRMSMLTGRHPYQNACWNNSHILDSHIPTFAHALGAVGYRTILAGRMHSLGPDQLRGYSERLVGDHSPNPEGNPSGPGTPGRGPLEGTAGPARVSLTNSGAGQGGYQVHDEHVTAAAVDVLNRLGVDRRSLPTEQEPQPFLLSVGLMLPHQPFVARHDEYERYRGRVLAPKHAQPQEPDHPYFQWWRERTGITGGVTAEEQERCRTAYWALVDRMDAMIGQILHALEENGFTQDTLIVYTTDHGEQAGEHGLWWKQTMYEASARVPLLVSWPGVVPPAMRVKRVVSTLDVTATLLDAAGAPALPDMAGRSLLGVIGDPNSPVILSTAKDPFLPRPSAEQWKDIAFSEFCVEEGWYQRMIRSGPWKLVHYHGYRPQLFHLNDDPDELHDLAEDPRHAATREALTRRVLEGWDADAIAAQSTLKRKQAGILRAWARTTHPTEQHRWHITREMHYLEDPPVSIPEGRKP